MVTLEDLRTLFVQLGIDPTDLVADVTKKVASHGGEKLLGASKGVAKHLIDRVRAWKKSEALAATLAADEGARRSTILAKYFEDWVKDQSGDAIEIAHLLYRLVYLRALRLHRSALPLVAGTDRSLDLTSVWVPQTFRKASDRDRDEVDRRGAEGQTVFDDLAQAVVSCGNPVAILGVPGSGKSTQLRKLVLDRVDDLLATDDFKHFEPLPIYLLATFRRKNEVFK